jgi:hypothetical protein
VNLHLRIGNISKNTKIRAPMCAIVEVISLLTFSTDHGAKFLSAAESDFGEGMVFKSDASLGRGGITRRFSRDGTPASSLLRMGRASGTFCRKGSTNDTPRNSLVEYLGDRKIHAMSSANISTFDCLSTTQDSVFKTLTKMKRLK